LRRAIEIMEINPLVTLIIGGLVTALGQLILARYAKPKRERDAALSEVYLKLADMTADQLEEKINRITHLDKQVQEMAEDNRKLKRDWELEQVETTRRRAEMDSQIRVLEGKLRDSAFEVQQVRNKNSLLEKEIIDLKSENTHQRNQNNTNKRVIDKLLEALHEAKIPLPDFNGDLSDSVKLKLQGGLK
jgi:chromosome segregation ATPase